jgi:hypothetical protein
MAKTLPVPPPGFKDLSVEEQIDYIQDLWERIAASSSWEEVREAIKKRLDSADE